MLLFKSSGMDLRGLIAIIVLVVGLLPWTGGVRAEPPQPTPTPTRAPFAYGVSFLSPSGQVGTMYWGTPDSVSDLVSADSADLIAEALSLINDARQAAGLPALLSSDALAEAAADHAADQLANGFFEHQGSDRSWPATRAARRGHPAAYVGENLAAGYTTAQETVEAWLAADGSRANLLDAGFTHAGLAFVHNGPWHNYWVLLLGDLPAYRPGRVLVRFQPAVSAAGVQETLAQVNASSLGPIGGLDVERWAVPVGQETAVVAALQQNPAVVFAEPDYRVQATLEPDDPNYAGRWWWTKIQAPDAWDVTTGSDLVTIAVIDTGVDLDHPDLAAKIVPGYDFVSSDDDPDDDHGHGTHVAGIAAAVTNNGTGVAGLSWGARIMPLKVLDSRGEGWFSDVADAITYAADHGAQVINMSLGSKFSSSTVATAVGDAHARGVFVAAAAGNYGDSDLVYPAAHDHVVGVAATTSSDSRASFSSYGSHVDVAAPGTSIYSTGWVGDTISNCTSEYCFKSGTSMATPFVSGMAALIFSADSHLTPDEVEAIVEQSADDLGDPGRDDYYGWGRLNTSQALNVSVQANGLYISGRISTTSGSALANVTVAISGTGILSTTLTNSEGQYLQTGLITGTYMLAPSQGSASFTPISRTVSVGPDSATGVDFTRDDLLVCLPLAAKDYEGPMLLPNDAYFGSQWGLHNTGQTGGTQDADIDAPQAWYQHTGDSSVIVAILDTGVDLDHPEFSGRLTAGWDYVNGDNDPDDDEGHGTHVAGIAAATGNNGQGVAGVAWGVRIMPVKVLDSDGGGWYSDMISGINYAVNNGAQVINMSLGGLSYSQSLQDAVTNAYNQNVLVIAATGNCRTGCWIDGHFYVNPTNYPAANAYAMGVASTTRTDTYSSFSNYGSYVDIAAPGSSIYSTYRGSGYGYMDGTSMATPFVAGLAGLIYSKYPSYTAAQVAQAIVHNADDLGAAGRDDTFGCGRINAHNSLAYGAASNGCSGWSGFSLESVQAQAAPPAADVEFRPGLLLVKFNEVTSLAEREDVLTTHGLTTLQMIEGLEIYLVGVPEGQELTLAEILSADATIAYAEPDYKVYAAPLRLKLPDIAVKKPAGP